MSVRQWRQVCHRVTVPAHTRARSHFPCCQTIDGRSTLARRSGTMQRHSLQVLGARVLRTPCEPVRLSEVAALRPLLQSMARVMKQENGMGIAAPQLGSSIRVFMMMAKGRPLVVINPRIVRASRARAADWESCLSVPEYGALVERHCSVDVKFETINGATVQRMLHGNSARVYQHELDHLDGRLYTSRMFEPSFAPLSELETPEQRARFEELYDTTFARSSQ